MKQLFEKMGFQKMDEMEKEIALKSQRNALTYVIVVLFIWSTYELYCSITQQVDFNKLPCILLITTAWVQTISQLLLKRRAVMGDSEYKFVNKNTVITFAIATTLIIIVGMLIYTIIISAIL